MIILLFIANRNTIRRYTGKISRKRLKPIILNTTRRILNPLHSHLSYLDYYKRCYDALKSAPADIYHAHDLNTLIIGWWCKRKFGGKLVYDSHELFTEQGLLTKSNRIVWAQIEKKLIKKCDKVITVCDSIAAELRNRYNIAQPTVIRNCPESNGCETGPHEFIRAATGIDANTPVILYQGGFSKNRGLKSLILSTRYFDQGKLVMMGWGNVEEELKAFTRSKGLAKKVCFIPPVPQSELLSWSSSADLGVIPYRAVGLNNYYSCPNKLFEYINAGLPVTGSDFPELRKIINGWKIGRTFDPEDPQSIGKTINGILADKHLLKEMRANSVHASKTLNWQCESEILLGVYSGFKRQQLHASRQEGIAVGDGQLLG